MLRAHIFTYFLVNSSILFIISLVNIYKPIRHIVLPRKFAFVVGDSMEHKISDLLSHCNNWIVGCYFNLFWPQKQLGIVRAKHRRRD